VTSHVVGHEICLVNRVANPVRHTVGLGINSVLRSGPVWSFTLEVVQPGPRPVAIYGNILKTRLRLLSTSLCWSGCSQATSWNWSFQRLVDNQSRPVGFQLQPTIRMPNPKVWRCLFNSFGYRLTVDRLGCQQLHHDWSVTLRHTSYSNWVWHGHIFLEMTVAGHHSTQHHIMGFDIAKLLLEHNINVDIWTEDKQMSLYSSWHLAMGSSTSYASSGSSSTRVQISTSGTRTTWVGSSAHIASDSGHLDIVHQQPYQHIAYGGLTNVTSLSYLGAMRLLVLMFRLYLYYRTYHRLSRYLDP
jgi:hypothetical protein